MAECNVQTLATDAACFAAETSGQLDALQAVLLCRILQALDPTMECNVQELMDDAACFAALPLGMLKLIQVQLLCEINTSIVNALPGCTPTDPNGVVTGLFCGQLITALDTGAKYTFQGTVGTNVGWA